MQWQRAKSLSVVFGLMLSVAACGSENEGAAEAPESAGAPEGSGEGAGAPDGPPSIGDSCEGQVSAGEGLTGCDGQWMMFCSSYSDYRWQQTQECPEGTTCVAAEDGSSASCE